MEYEELDKHFTKPSIISHFYGDIRIPRKQKKKVRNIVGIYWELLNNAQRCWYYLRITNLNYTRYIIKKICETHTTYNQVESLK